MIVMTKFLSNIYPQKHKKTAAKKQQFLINFKENKTY